MGPSDSVRVLSFMRDDLLASLRTAKARATPAYANAMKRNIAALDAAICSLNLDRGTANISHRPRKEYLHALCPPGGKTA